MGMITQVRSAAARALQPNAQPTAAQAANRGEFARMLQQKLDAQKIAVSAHAADRMVRRGLIPTDGTINQLNTAFELAEKRGSREALFLLDDLAVIASVPNRTVKTAMGRSNLEAGVFTHIDAAIVLPQEAPSNSENNSQVNRSPRSDGWTSTEGAAIQQGGPRQ